MRRRFHRTAVLAGAVFALVSVTIPCVAGGVRGAVDEEGAVDPDLVSRELEDILSQPEYNRQFGTSWMDEIWPRVVEWLESLFKRFRLPFRADMGGTASIIFASLVFVALAGLFWLLLRSIRGAACRSHTAGEALQTTSPLPSSAPLMDQARKLAADGDYRGAFRCAYLASLSYLDETGALRFERSRTNWEYLRELEKNGHLGPCRLLVPLTMDFDRKFYGRQQCTEHDYRKAADTFRAIASEVRS